ALRGCAGGARAGSGAQERVVAPLRSDQCVREASVRQRDHDIEILSEHLARRAEAAPPGTDLGSTQELEVCSVGFRGSRPLGPLPQSLRAGADGVLDRRGALVRDPVGQEMVSESRGGADHRSNPREDESALSAPQGRFFESKAAMTGNWFRSTSLLVLLSCAHHEPTLPPPQTPKQEQAAALAQQQRDY